MGVARPAAALAAVLAAAGATVALDRDDGPDHPDDWDERVVDLVDYVEEERDLRFEHPVAIDFLTADEYGESIRSDESELTEDDEAAIASSEAFLRALGLAEGDLDLFETTNDVVDLGTLAYYSSEDERIVVRGTDMSVDLRVTLVHELVHVLQDQHFDLDSLYEDADDGAILAIRGLVEGDALRIDQRYADEELTEEERAQYDEATNESIAESEAGLADAPPGYVAFFEAPYAFGEPFLLALEASRLVDDAFEEPPTSEEQLADPARFVDRDEPEEVEAPSGDGEVVDESTIGWIGWYVVLAERLDPFVALDAVDGWDGDAYEAYEDGDRTCVRAAVATDSTDDRGQLRAALDGWAATMPAEAEVRVDEDGDLLRLDVCDPGPDVETGTTGRSQDALALPAVRSYVVADALNVFATADSFCVADTVIRSFNLDQLSDPAGTIFTDGSFGTAVQDAVASCEAGP